MPLRFAESLAELEALAVDNEGARAAVDALKTRHQEVLTGTPDKVLTPEMVTAAMDYWLEAQRHVELLRSQLFENDAIREGVLSQQSWSNESGLQHATEEMTEALAESLLGTLHIQPGERVLIISSPHAKQVMEKVVAKVLKAGAEVRLLFQDDRTKQLLVNAGTEEGVRAMGSRRADQFVWAEKMVGAMATESIAIEDSDHQRWYDTEMKRGSDRVQSGALRRTTTLIPSQLDAKRDGMGYKEYVEQIYFESCDQPWEQIFEAQQKLKRIFDKAQNVHITNEDGTDVTLDITGQTFANSVTWANVPGSELFSSPKRTGVNGTIVAQGKFMYEGKEMTDIRLTIVNGKIVDFDAATGKEHLQSILDKDKDDPDTPSRFLGEIGIGTNPHLAHLLASRGKSTVNRLLVEKVGGSFHVAIGGCYRITEYAGEQVNLQNGNVSPSGLHWDLTTVLRGKGGQMYLDGQLVQQNGMWIANEALGITREDVAVLNEGWGALPERERPDWFKDQYPNGYIMNGTVPPRAFCH